MGNTQSGKPVIIQQAPISNGAAAVLTQNKFDNLIWKKGYNVYLDKAMDCPCRNVGDAQSQTACRNCGGSGYIFINRTKTKMVIQGMNADTKFKEWSKELRGTAKITCLNANKLVFMDRVTFIDTLSTVTQVVIGKEHDDSIYRAMVVYPIKEVEAAFIYIDNNTKLTRAIEGVHYNIVDENWIEFISGSEFITMTIRYKHNPMYYIIDEARAIMSTPNKDEEIQEMPLHAIGRLAHYVLDQDKFNGGYLFNNNFIPDECGVEVKIPCES